ncbi:type I-E CRISPR-associated protein Cas7/Cse4/CasC [Actinomyces sp. B33]|uniref:type I-E CRISPR-associated protein Cas7/Cse4/CasC n=1 Tax=Actinomyces sp. B33 TaxID=2942131 RepID=UPI002340CE5C|nr:type I-E CRISPR-associated protein Cas7/Cse4/CasC [Actinomyces sp. B33]MDC4232363.1 type I-E CRISPR-associated protein Cas7/Cse4/CasC [Actinomyces sp. B33]
MTRFVDIHILQTLPPSNPNRDDTGAPKNAVFGGARRMRISSQAIKRATRMDFESALPEGNRGIRTKRIVELLRDAIVDRRADLAERATDLAETALTAIGFKLGDPRGKKTDEQLKEAGFLVFLSAKQIEHVADAIVSVSDEQDVKAAFKALKPKSLVDTDHSVDIALFGRMVAEPNSLNVDAACQVAHALGVGAVESEYDYYTAVDDAKSADDEADEGAGMIGTIEFASATLYRYATINLDLLAENLGSVAVADEAVRLFVDSFVRAMPTGKITTFANRTLPDAVLVHVRDDQPINLVGAFETPVQADRSGYVAPAVDQFIAYEKAVEEGTGTAPLASLAAWTTDRADRFDELGHRVPLVDLGTQTVAVLQDAR